MNTLSHSRTSYRISPLAALPLALSMLALSAHAACAAPTDESQKPSATASAQAAAAPTAAASASAGEVFDPQNPPPGWTTCHRNHCHHRDGRVASYAQVMQEVGATRIAGQEAAPAAPPAPPDVAIIPMDADKSATGLVTRVVKPGSGSQKPGPESIVTVHYTGWTPDGKSFDSSIPRNQPARFPLNRVMPGWSEGIQQMVVGEERRFWMPEELAYQGAAGKPKGLVVFDIELIAIGP